MSGHRLETQGLVLSYGDAPVVDDLSVAIPDSRITVVVGANGCGKSTLLRGMARLVAPVRGAVLLDGKSVHHTPSKEVARVLGLAGVGGDHGRDGCGFGHPPTPARLERTRR